MVIRVIAATAISTLNGPVAGMSEASWSSADEVETATVIT